MENTFFKLAAIPFLVLGFFAFTVIKPGSITGKITPADALKDVWVVSPKDTIRALVIQGSFTIVNVKPGTYTVIINATEPYKDEIKEDVTVLEGGYIYLGEIKLKK
jgi:hypothetical protein